MNELRVLICWRGFVVLVPVPGAAASRVNGMAPRLFLNFSIGSLALNVMFDAAPVPPCARPMLWSMNCPNAQPHALTTRSEKTFWVSSLNTRSLTERTFGPLTCEPLPSP